MPRTSGWVDLRAYYSHPDGDPTSRVFPVWVDRHVTDYHYHISSAAGRIVRYLQAVEGATVHGVVSDATLEPVWEPADLLTTY